jgi:hypothetical protein
MLIVGESRTQTVDGIERARADVMEGAPVKGNKVTRLSALKKAQRIRGSEMSFPKARFPPRSVSNWQQCDVELTLSFGHVLVNDTVRIVGEGSITSKENGMLLGK